MRQNKERECRTLALHIMGFFYCLLEDLAGAAFWEGGFIACSGGISLAGFVYIMNVKGGIRDIEHHCWLSLP